MEQLHEANSLGSFDADCVQGPVSQSSDHHLEPLLLGPDPHFSKVAVQEDPLARAYVGQHVLTTRGSSRT